MVRRAGIVAISMILLLSFQSIESKQLEFGENIKTNPFVMEGEKLDVVVEFDGKGIANADVYLKRENLIFLHGKTNETGHVIFDIPEVNFSIPCKLIALKQGYESREMKVWILNRPKLYIVSKRVVEEEKEVEIKVIDQDLEPVSYAIVSVDGEEILTNETGCCRYVAPKVGFSTYVDIEARKDGYENSDKMRLWIADNRSSNLDFPLWVYEGERFEIEYRGREDVKISFGDEIFDENRTELEAPYLNRTRVYQIKVYDLNNTILDYGFVIVLDKKERALIFSPSTVLENNAFDVSLLSLEDLSPICGERLRFAEDVGVTDDNGTIDFLAPEINKDYELFSLEVLNHSILADERYVWIKKPENLSLIIEGPSTVKSGENVTFNITDIHGNRIFSIIYLLNSTFYAMNGSARVKIPDVEESGYAYLKARSPGYQEAEKIIYISSKERRLSIECEDSVKEGDVFTVRIKDQDGNLVGDALVWFNFRYYRTDDNGEIEITAPDVLLSSRYMIYAEKEGYMPASRWITVVESGIGERFMKIISPLAVSPWDEFEIRVVDSRGNGIADVEIEMRYGSIENRYETNKSGYISINAPPYGEDDYLILTASKDKYAEDTVSIKLIPKIPNLPSISVYPSKTSLMEGESLVIEISDENGKPIENADVWVDGRYLYKSDANGMIICKAPPVSIDRSCFIYAVKEGYNFGYAWIKVINRIEFEEPLIIDVNYTVYEGERFTVRVKDSSGEPIQGVYVWFDSVKKLTSADGTVDFIAPYVEKDSYKIVGIESEEYVPSYRLIRVIDRHNETPSLNISVPPRIFEGEILDIVVRDDYGYLVKNATIMINGEVAGYTNEYGRFRFKVPEVDHDSVLDIMALKLGYESSTSSIEIKNRERTFFEENWYLIPFAIVIILIAVIAYFYYQQRII